MSNMKIRKWWKEQWCYQYLFNRNYDSPFVQFFSKNDSQEIFKSMLDTILKPRINLSFDSPKDVWDIISFLDFDSWVSLTDTWISVSPVVFVVHKLFDTILKESSSWALWWIIEFHRLQILLKWWMAYQHYTNWKMGEKLMDLLDVDCEKGYGTLLYFWNLLVSQYLEFTSFNSSLANQYLMQTEILMHTMVWKNVDREKIIKFIDNKLKNNLNAKFSYKFSNEWINLAKKRIENPDIIQWFREVRIKEIPIKTVPSQEMRLYLDMINALFFDEELFFYYSPSTFDIWICDKNHINIYNHTYIFLSFSNLVRTLFCDNCIDKWIEDIKSKIWENKRDNINATKELLKKISERLISIHPDDFTLNVEWIVHDTNRFSEIKSKNPYGHTATNGEWYSEKHVRFNNKHVLSKFKNSEEKKQMRNKNNE